MFEVRSQKIDAVLPLLARDAERAKILFDSLRLFRDLGTCWVIVRDRELAELRVKIPEKRFLLIPESTLIPELGIYRILWRLRGKGNISGWYVQQLLKMAMAEKVQTDFYLTLDADVICMKPVSYDDLVKKGRAISRRTAKDGHANWYQWAERVLGLPRSPFQHGVTPALLSREAMIRLQKYLATRTSLPVRSGWKRGVDDALMGKLMPSWRSYLIRNLPWTEYSLYGTFLDASGLYDRYHWDGGPDAIYSNSVWYPETFEAWAPHEIFNRMNSYFCVIQSTTGIDPTTIRARLERPLPTPQY